MELETKIPPSVSILLVEDNNVDAMFVERVLERGKGNYCPSIRFCITRVSSLTEAKELAQSSRAFEVVLLDLGLPDSSGAASVPKVVEAYPSSSVIVLTGLEDEEVSLEALQLGADDYIFKAEVSATELKRCILYSLERRKAQEQFYAAERELQELQRIESLNGLAAGIAHEVSSPAQYIATNLAYLKDAFEKTEKIVEAGNSLVEELGKQEDLKSLAEGYRAVLKEIELDKLQTEVPDVLRDTLRGIDKISEIVSSMLKFSHPGGDEREPLDIHEAVRTAIIITQCQWKELAEVQLRFAENTPRVSAHPQEINQVILNLLINAISAIQEKQEQKPSLEGKITITTEYDEKHVILQLRDNGLGIPKEVQPRIFDPFFTTKEVGKGSGQGLAIVRTIIEKHHDGEITYSTEVDHGTTFAVKLPVWSEEYSKNGENQST